MTHDQAHQAARFMRNMGSFASAIADAFFVADSSNQAKLLEAFQDLFSRAFQYSTATK